MKNSIKFSSKSAIVNGIKKELQVGSQPDGTIVSNGRVLYQGNVNKSTYYAEFYKD